MKHKSKKSTTQYCSSDHGEAEELPLPIFGLPCRDKCPEGTYATVSHQSRQWECLDCPANSYSAGHGGIRIDGTMGAFGGGKGETGNHWPYLMEPSCQVMSDFDGEDIGFFKN